MKELSYSYRQVILLESVFLKLFIILAAFRRSESYRGGEALLARPTEAALSRRSLLNLQQNYTDNVKVCPVVTFHCVNV